MVSEVVCNFVRGHFGEDCEASSIDVFDEVSERHLDGQEFSFESRVGLLAWL